MKIQHVDFAIPTRTRPNETLLHGLAKMPGVEQIIITKERPLSIARKHAIMKARTDWVAMVDDDMILPEDWLSKISSQIAPKIGAVATVCVHKDRHVAAYDRVVGAVVGLHEIDTSPHINNVLIKRSILEDYNPPPLFFGEDQFLKKFIERAGYIWKVVPFIGATHLGTSKNHVIMGIAYRRYEHYSIFQLMRRMVARFIFTPFAAMSNLSLGTLEYLIRLNVQFIAGWAKEFISYSTRHYGSERARLFFERQS
jgi:glycosyltransferase involved in cell wall biosynthesis